MRLRLRFKFNKDELMLFRALICVAALSLSASAQALQWGIDTSTVISGLTQTASNRIAIADLNLDGRLDLVVVGSAGYVLLGQASGALTLQAASITVTGSSLSLGDVTDDGIPDMLVAGATTTLWRGVGDGTFVTHPLPLGVPSSWGSGNPAGSGLIEDFNADGEKDIAVATGGNTSGVLPEVRVSFGVGGGTFLLPISLASCSGTPTGMISADINIDGVKDIVIPCTSAFTVIFGSTSANLTTVSIGRDAIGFPAVADFTLDGIPDVIAGSGYLLVGLGNGLFSAGPQVTSPTTGRMRSFDADGDGDWDAAIPTTGGNILLSRNNSGASLDNSVGLNVGTNVRDMAIGNIRGDPRVEILVLADNSSGGSRVVVLKNLAPNCNGNAIDDVIEIAQGLVTDCDVNGVPDVCQTDCDANDQPDVCQIAALPSLDMDTDGTLDSCEIVGTPYCFGDGTGILCPCDPGQAGAPGSGCKNATGVGGRLRAVGNASVVLDSVTMTGSGIGPFAMGMLFQGTTQQSGGQGMSFGDGLVCVNGTIVRFTPRPSSADGVTQWGRAIAGDPPIATYGQLPVGGGTRYYQIWYRDSTPNYCTPATNNLTNGLGIAWIN